MKKMLCIAIVLILASASMFGQLSNNLNFHTISSHFSKQLSIFPQEKIHLHIDKPYYISGENIWLRAHVVNASSHVPYTASRYVYVELINPMDSVVKRIKIRPENNMFYGYIKLNEDLPVGDYQIRAYTKAMIDIGNNYFFNQMIKIENPTSVDVKTEFTFNYEENNRIRLKIGFIDSQSNAPIKPRNIKVTYNKKTHFFRKLDGNNELNFLIDSSPDNHLTIHIEFNEGNIFYSRYMHVPVQDNDYDVSFFPEGGSLLQGVNCKVAFKALKSNGLSDSITGEIVNSKGEVVTTLTSFHLGMGFFNIIAEEGETYYAVCRNKEKVEKRFILPEAQSNKFGIAARWTKDKLVVSVLKSEGLITADSLYLFIHSRGIPTYFSSINKVDELIILDGERFPLGVTHIVLLDSQGNILSERLAFTNKKDRPKVLFNTDKSNYEVRQKVLSQIRICDKENKPVLGNFSVSVIDDEDLRINTNSSIISSLLLSSEIKGHIEAPTSYLKYNDRYAQQALDVLMLTQGWRRYGISSVLRGYYQLPKVSSERSQEIRGQVLKRVFKVKGAKRGQISLISTDYSFFDTVETNYEGNFVFENFEFPDSTKYVVQALSEKGSGNVELILNNDTFPPILPFRKYIDFDNAKSIIEAEAFNYIVKANQKYSYENGMRMIHLKEVSVRGQRKNEEVNTSLYSQSSTKAFTREQIEKVPKIELLLHQVPGLKIVDLYDYSNGSGGKYRPGYKRVLLNGQNSVNKASFALIIVDDIILEDFSIDEISVNDIERIDIIKGPESAILGVRGAGGAIAITTRKGGAVSRLSKENIKTIEPLGYQKIIEFYSPKYETVEEINSKMPDLRTTIYWKPNVVLSEKGEASFDFYTADSPNTTYSVVIEGVTSDGEIIHAVEKISVK